MSVEGEGGYDRQAAVRVLLCGGIAGVVTWASIFPLDVVKTRVQTQVMMYGEGSPFLQSLESSAVRSDSRAAGSGSRGPVGAWDIAKLAYREEGVRVFFRGLGVCSVRAFVVNAVQVC